MNQRRAGGRIAGRWHPYYSFSQDELDSTEFAEKRAEFMTKLSPEEAKAVLAINVLYTVLGQEVMHKDE